jgi:hypothetical protein
MWLLSLATDELIMFIKAIQSGEERHFDLT